MSEIRQPQESLWHRGPNYTADAVIVDLQQQKILLIERRDCGEWALPGGFVDANESAYEASIREAHEEATFRVTNGRLVYQGVVDDPRNTDDAWIETSAYLFESSCNTAIAGDDARRTQWFHLNQLPPLYASHRAIVHHALATYEDFGD